MRISSRTSQFGCLLGSSKTAGTSTDHKKIVIIGRHLAWHEIQSGAHNGVQVWRNSEDKPASFIATQALAKKKSKLKNSRFIYEYSKLTCAYVEHALGSASFSHTPPTRNDGSEPGQVPQICTHAHSPLSDQFEGMLEVYCRFSTRPFFAHV